MSPSPLRPRNPGGPPLNLNDEPNSAFDTSIYINPIRVNERRRKPWDIIIMYVPFKTDGRVTSILLKKTDVFWLKSDVLWP